MRGARTRRLRRAPAPWPLLLLLAGCGHDWSAIDTTDAESPDRTEDAPPEAADTPEDLPTSETDNTSGTDADDGETDDTAPDALPCTPGAAYCAEGDSLVVCDPALRDWVATVCPIACVDDERPHCARLVPSNLPPDDDWPAGAVDVACTGETLLFNTTDGRIDRERSDGREASLRAPGEGEIDGIPFRILPGPVAAPPLAVWSLYSLAVEEDCTVVFQGTAAAAVLIETDALIRGRVTAAARPRGGPPATPGPGGGAGGSPYAGGEGLGGGLPGIHGPQYTDGGSGGGGFGGAGGTGATLGRISGGAGGLPYGTAELVPLVGGSGGAGGVPASCGGSGGGGGGALQISAQDTIWISHTGVIDAGGAGGEGGRIDRDDAGSGGGGGSGGAILLEAARLELHGIVAANGGGGGGGASDERVSAGIPGADATTTTTAAPGGAEFPDGTAGGDGSSALDPNGRTGQPGTGDIHENGGGGGGGAGRIRLNVHHDVETPPEGHLSPATSTGLATFGRPAYQ